MPSTDYSIIESPDSSGNDTQLSPREIVAKRLEEAGLSSDCFIRLQYGSKAPISHDTYPLEEIDNGNYGVYAGDGLSFVDIDSYRDEDGGLSDEVQKHRGGLTLSFRITAEGRKMAVERREGTFTVQSPHGGEHLYYAVSGDVSNSTHGWGEIRAENQYVVGPDSELKDCDKVWHDCSVEEEGQYTIKHDRPIAPISASELPATSTPDSASSGSREHMGELPEYDDDLVDVGNQHLRTLQAESGSAFQCLMDRLKGGRGSLGEKLNRENDEGIDRSATDFVTLEHLYGVMMVFGNEDEQQARERAYAVYTYYCEQTKWMKDGQPRNWHVENQQYRENILTWAVNNFDRGKFQRWLKKRNIPTEEWRAWTGDYSDTTYNVVQFSLKLLSGGLPVDYDSLSPDRLQEIALTIYDLDVDPETLAEVVPLNNPPTPLSQGITPLEGCISQCDYPRKGEVIEVARRLDENHSKKCTYGEALNRLRRDGVAVMACLKEGVDYRYYSHGVPDPKDAEWIKTNGEKRPSEQVIES